MVTFSEAVTGFSSSDIAISGGMLGTLSAPTTLSDGSVAYTITYTAPATGGAGQMSRIDSSRIAVWKAGEAKLSLTGSAIASDAFFPFPDGLLAAADAGATCAIQPGGSVKDADVIAAADARGMAMVFTGMRHFKH